MDLIKNFENLHHWGVDNANDRRILVLLKHKEVKSRKDQHRIKLMEDVYPDNQKCEDVLIREMSARGFIRLMNSKVELNENGNYEETIKDLPKYHQTTKEGEKALKNNLFPSEYSTKQRDRFFRIIQSIGIWIAAIGGLITIISLFVKLFNG